MNIGVIEMSECECEYDGVLIKGSGINMFVSLVHVQPVIPASIPLLAWMVAALIILR